VKKTRILLVDDDNEFIKVKKEFLRGHGYETVWATAIQDALDILTVTPVHLLVINYALKEVVYKTDLTIPRVMIIAPLGDAELARTYQDVRRPLGRIDGPTLAHDLFLKTDDEKLVNAINQVILHHYNIQLLVDDSEALGRLLRSCRDWGVREFQEVDITFQRLLCTVPDCTKVVVTRVWPAKDSAQYIYSRICLASRRGSEYFTVAFGTTAGLMKIEATHRDPLFRGYGYHLAALGFSGTIWDKILDKVPWLERLVKPLWEIFKLALRFVK